MTIMPIIQVILSIVVILLSVMAGLAVVQAWRCEQTCSSFEARCAFRDARVFTALGLAVVLVQVLIYLIFQR